MPRKCSPGLPCPQVVEASHRWRVFPLDTSNVSTLKWVVLAKYLLLHTGLPIMLHHADRPRHRWLFRALKGSGLTQSNVSGERHTRWRNMEKEYHGNQGNVFPLSLNHHHHQKKNWKKNILIDNKSNKEKKKAAIFRKPSLKWSSTCVNLWNHPLKASVPCLVFLGGQKNENIVKNSICILRLSNLCKNV